MHLRMTQALDEDNKIESVLPTFSVGSIEASTYAAPGRIMVTRAAEDESRERRQLIAQ
jgi:hypothetical protein